MRVLQGVVFVTLCLAASLSPAGGDAPSWRWANPLPQGNPLYAIWGSSRDDIYAVGGAGTILHSRDGRTWEPEPSGTRETLYGVWGAADRVYAVGARGTVLRSTDSGRTWTKAAGVARSVDLHGIWGIGEEIYVVGAKGAIFHSGSSGSTWARRTSGTTRDLRGVWGSSAGDIYVVGDEGTVLHSTDSGRSFAPSGAEPDPDLALFSLWGSGKDDVYVAGATNDRPYLGLILSGARHGAGRG